jgi:transcriptional/translational regulatory protein YebC/TACO1
MIERFEEDDDISTVYHNLELTEALEAALNA